MAEQPLRALLLAAGMGSRLRPLTDTVPKCLVPIQGRPLLEYWLRLLVDGGVREILVNLHYMAPAVREYVSRSEFAPFVTFFEEGSLLGTGGTLLANRSFFEGGPTLLAHADNLTMFSIEAFLSAHRSRPAGTIMTMMTFETPTPESCGIVESDERGVVVGFHEKVKNPPGRSANAAVYLLEPKIFDLLCGLRKDVIDFSTEIIPQLMGKIFTYSNQLYHRDIGTMESWTEAQKDYATFLKRCQSQPSS